MDILEEMNLIKLYSQEIGGQYIEDESGNEICVPDYLDWIEIKGYRHDFYVHVR